MKIPCFILLMGSLLRGGLAGNSPPSCCRPRFLKKGRLFRGRVVMSRHLNRVARDHYFGPGRSTNLQSYERDSWELPGAEARSPGSSPARKLPQLKPSNEPHGSQRLAMRAAKDIIMFLRRYGKELTKSLAHQSLGLPKRTSWQLL